VTIDSVRAALATVKDPEIRRPITDLGMVDQLGVGADGVVDLTVLLTIAGCPMRDTLTRAHEVELTGSDQLVLIADKIRESFGERQTPSSSVAA